MTFRTPATLLMLACTFAVPAAASSGSAKTMYERVLEREQSVRNADQLPTAGEIRSLVNAYIAIVRRFPASGYSDNALWQAGNLAALAYERFGQASDREAARRYFIRLKQEYPASSLRSNVDQALKAIGDVEATAGRDPVVAAPLAPPDQIDAKPIGLTAGSTGSVPDTSPALILIRDIKRTAIPDGMRVTIEMASETSFRAERLENPRRVFFDLRGTRPVPSLLDATLRYSDEIVREIRLGRHPQSTTRIVFDMQGVDSYSVFTLYSPFRLVIDFKPQTAVAGSTGTKPPAPIAMAPSLADTRRPASRPVQPDLKPSVDTDARAVKALSKTTGTVAIPPPVPSLTLSPLSSSTAAKLKFEPLPQIPLKPAPARTTAPAAVTSALPAANLDGKFSLARQLGLGVARVVIDAGHGGHDPGAQGNGVNESELTLDVATRLSKLLQKQPGVEVVMTRDTDVFVPLEERTAIANREGADLFLSIHANASRNPRAAGVETYFLNFASNQDAEAVAARENSGSARAMHSLPDIVKAIALNNKLDESRDFADIVQRSMVKRLSTRNKQLRDLGVKQAPFVVLIGASMPSVLAEISFVTHRQEGQLLKSTAYRQQIAEALYDAVVKYQESLKTPRAGVVGMGAR
jgi:N-acetylmuramoyl-L-alanine amidase